MNALSWKSALSDGSLDAALRPLYGDISAARARLAAAVDGFVAAFGDGDLRLFSAPGRTELSGNHTDHNRGRVLAGAVDLDVLAVVRPRTDGIARVRSEGFPEDIVDLSALAPVEGEKGTSAALIRGTAARFVSLGYAVGGFDAYTVSRVPKGSGLSSSAAFEVLIGTVLNGLYNNGAVDPVTVATIAQYAENAYFGKPCGLMDQMASSVGGVITIDFADSARPLIEKVPFDLAPTGLRLYVVDTRGDHADLTAEYAAVPAEMKAVAAALGHTVLRETNEAAVLAALPRLRRECGDRAVLRALHFLRENDRVAAQTDALRRGDTAAFLDGVLASGRSSFEYLQNVYPAADPARQAVSLALALCEGMLSGRGAWRVHGGGFAGTIQAYVPAEDTAAFTAAMESAFGGGCCRPLTLRSVGGTEIAGDVL